jgi:putative FmdB family regulatory protein
MPLYDFTCPRGHTFERMVPLASFDDAQACECGEGARRLISAPRVLSDQIAPVRGADGKIHDSLRGLRASYLSGGNPQGERYFEVGDQKIETALPKFDRKQRRDDIKAAMEDVKNGRVAPIPPAPPGM